jgi:hypothetical protein
MPASSSTRAMASAALVSLLTSFAVIVMAVPRNKVRPSLSHIPVDPARHLSVVIPAKRAKRAQSRDLVITDRAI